MCFEVQVTVLLMTCSTALLQYMDFDYHDSYRRLMHAMREAEYETCEAIKSSADSMVEQAKTLNFEGDLHYFLSEYATPFTPPNPFQFTPFQGDDVSCACDQSC